jgi:hypothetical protein
MQSRRGRTMVHPVSVGPPACMSAKIRVRGPATIAVTFQVATLSRKSVVLQIAPNLSRVMVARELNCLRPVRLFDR